MYAKVPGTSGMRAAEGGLLRVLASQKGGMQGNAPSRVSVVLIPAIKIGDLGMKEMHGWFVSF